MTYVCSECGKPVGRYIPFLGGWVDSTEWMHDDGTEGADCANARGDRPWSPVELEGKVER